MEIKEREVLPLLWSVTYHFLLLCSFHVLRPVRDEMGIQGGVGVLQWVFTGTFVVMLGAVPLFGWAVRRYRRIRLVPRVYYVFGGVLLVFYALFQSGIAEAWVARGFFVWVSVLNLFVVSVFWSLMADLFAEGQARRLFGVVAVGGSAGAVAGPLLSAGLVQVVRPIDLVPVAAALLMGAVACVHALVRAADRATARREATPPRASEEGREQRRPEEVATTEPSSAGATPASGEAPLWAGMTRVFRSPYLLGVAGFIVLYTGLSAVLYFEQARIVSGALHEPSQRTTLFAVIDLSAGVLTILAQTLLTARAVERFGLPGALALVPLGVAAGFGVLGAFPVLAVVVVFQALRRAGNYAITRPAREMLFAPLPRRDQYQSKNFIDTVVYRGGDVLGGWAFTGLLALGLSLSAVALVAVPVALVWAGAGWQLGQRYDGGEP